MEKILSFTDLKVWQKAHKFIVKVYKVVDAFPEKEKFGLCSQMRRASVSITSNIAEGFGRRHEKEKIHFYSYAQGSIFEIQNQLLLSKDLNYIKEDVFQALALESVEISKMLTSLIHKIKSPNC